MKSLLIFILFSACFAAVFGQQGVGSFEQTGRFTPNYKPIQTAPEKYIPAVIKHKTTIIEQKAKDNSGISILKDEKIAELNKQIGLSSDHVNFMYEDTQKRVWIGTANGLNLLINDQIYKMNHSNVLFSENIKSVVQETENIFWVATDLGLVRLQFTKDLELFSIFSIKHLG